MNDKELIYYIKGKLEGMDKKLDEVCVSVAENRKKINEHEKFIGKAGVYITGFVFFFGAIFNFVFDWVKSKF